MDLFTPHPLHPFPSAQAQHVFTSRLAFRPAALSGRVQQRLTRAVAEKAETGRRTRVIDSRVNPEILRRQAMEEEEQRSRKANRLANRQRRARERGVRRATAQYMEDAYDEEVGGIAFLSPCLILKPSIFFFTGRRG